MKEMGLILIISLLLILPIAYGSCPAKPYTGCPPLIFEPPGKMIDSKIYVVPGTKVTSCDCGTYIHTCSNTAGYYKYTPHYITITGSPNKDFFALKITEENVTITKEEILNTIKNHTYTDITFTTLQPIEIKLEDIPAVDDIQGVPPYTINCEDYTTTTTLNFTYVPELEIRVHQSLHNFTNRINNTQIIETNVIQEDDLIINTTLITKLIAYLEPLSTASDKITVNTTITNITNVTNVTSGESTIEETEEVTTKHYYVHYERIFIDFYDNLNVVSRFYSRICGVTADIPNATNVTTYTFTKGGIYYIYGSFGYTVTVTE